MIEKFNLLSDISVDIYAIQFFYRMILRFNASKLRGCPVLCTVKHPEVTLAKEEKVVSLESVNVNN